MKPHVENAPGLTWRQKNDGTWEAIWRARKDIIKRQFPIKNRQLWEGVMPTETEAAQIADTCRGLQDEMLIFGRGGLPQTTELFNGTLGSLIACYRTDPDSTFHKKRYEVRRNHHMLLNRIVAKHGHEELSDINARLLLAWHKQWSGATLIVDGDQQRWADDGTKVAIAHAFIGHLRTIFGFGFTLLENAQCERLCAVLHKMKFAQPKPRTDRLTADQVIAHRAKAHWRGWNYMALADALQFEGTLRQKDVIGEWVPLSEPGISATIRQDKQIKWMTGIDWSEIDENLILRHTTSKRSKLIEIDLRLAPMVLEELADLVGQPILTIDDATKAITVHRHLLPAKGPVILCEVTGYPYLTIEFRRKWRIVANLAGLPKTVRSMDARAGAISEAVSMGARLELVRHAATHSNIAMTQRYDREAAEATASVMRTRVEGRNKPKTNKP